MTSHTLSHVRIKPLTIVALVAFGIVAAQQASAGIAGGWTRNSTVGDSVTDNGGGSWSYSYTVNNTSQRDGGNDPTEPIVVDWELPWFADAGITNITSPTNWAHTIETIGVPNPATGWEGVAAWQNPGDGYYFGDTSPFTTATQVLHWYNQCWAGRGEVSGFAVDVGGPQCEGEFDNAIFASFSLDGFGFDAGYAPTAAPYQASWANLPVRSGDPAFPLGGGIPGSPNALGTQVVPEPGVLGLLGLGLAAMTLVRRRN